MLFSEWLEDKSSLPRGQGYTVRQHLKSIESGGSGGPTILIQGVKVMIPDDDLKLDVKQVSQEIAVDVVVEQILIDLTESEIETIERYNNLSINVSGN